ncbi:Flp pilus assembly complex ATPase component TadA [Candidatus Parcubacteria bacterium]|nr:Flp pilus assembly complex ATPase component TadA [Candidatus Parcubacteria bacterium]
MHIETEQMKTFLLDAGLATAAKIKQAEDEAARTGQKLADILVNSKVITAEELIKLQAYILGVPFIDLSEERVDPSVLQMIPEPLARAHFIVAFRKKGNTLEVAMLDPDDLQTIDFLKKKTRLKILPRLTTPAAIKHILQQYQKSLEAEFGDIIKQEASGLTALPEGEAEVGVAGEDLVKMAEDLPIIRIVDTLLKHAILQSASDIHIEPLEKEVLVRYRIDGILHDAMTLPKAVQAGITARLKVLANLKLDEHRLPQDGRFKIESDEYQVSFRVSILPVFDGEKIVMRLLRENSQGLTLEGLGFRSHALELMHQNIKRPVGMVLVTGPTGSGKTTTLYTVMDILNTPQVNISTIEDPIEYRMPRINQTQVKPHIGLTFANGLRSLVRQDPDIVMVGEIRDAETASLAINAALTGHLVLSTLHTNSAAGALPRLIDMQVEPFLIASTVNLIVAQRLVRKLCDDKEKYRFTQEQVAILKRDVDLDGVLEILKRDRVITKNAAWTDIDLYRPKPSTDCPDGYKGRVGIYEALSVTSTIRELITKSATADELEAQARREGMDTMVEDGFVKAVQGLTTVEEVLRVIRE